MTLSNGFQNGSIQRSRGKIDAVINSLLVQIHHGHDGRSLVATSFEEVLSDEATKKLMFHVRDI